MLLAVLLVAASSVAPSHPSERLRPPPLPAIGSETVVATGLIVARPAARSCTVNLFADTEFKGEAQLPIAYRPPAECPGPWAKVVFEGDFRVTAGEQYDRTGFVTLAGVNLFTGTTMEPRKALAPTWHVERDVTDYAALFAAPRDGQALLTNYVDERYTGRVFWSGRLVFYPAAKAGIADTADFIKAVTDRPVQIDAASPLVTRTITFPRNLQRLMIDVLAQPQADDEFWWICQPKADKSPEADKSAADKTKATDCGRPFRDVEVLIDGRIAGLAAAYPWIYTGGVNPRMWTLAAGVEALDLSPTRVDLTPFAALVNDGKPHTVAIRVAGASRYFFAMGTLLGWRDVGRKVVTGALDTSTLAPARVALTGGNGPVDEDRFGDAVTTAARAGQATGHLDTSRGRVTTTVAYRMAFRNVQRGAAGGGRIDQDSDVETQRTIRDRDGVRRHSVVERFPLLVEIASSKEGADRISDMHFRQGLTRTETDQAGGKTRRRMTSLLVEPRVHSTIPPSGRRDAKSQATTVSTTIVRDDDAGCYDRTVTVTDGRVAAVRDGCAADRKE